MTSKPARKKPALTEDPFLKPFLSTIEYRQAYANQTAKRLTNGTGSLQDFASAHEYFGLHLRGTTWFFREWAPNAVSIYLIGDFNAWQERPEYQLQRISESGIWELQLPENSIAHGQLYKLTVHWNGGHGERIPAFCRRVVQDHHTLLFSAQVWNPARHYEWTVPQYRHNHKSPLIYEAHVGMAQENETVGSYLEFAERIIPRISKAGYNTIQLMAVMEHPYYGSFGYHVSSFFAASSRFGTPEELKFLIDTAHKAGISVIMDLVHSHAAINEVEGLSRFDGTEYQYFHQGPRGHHPAWGSRCFDYSKPEVLHFLLSNCRYWLDEYKVDGFRFDGITSMLYHHHGLGTAFDGYNKYFDSSVDEDALAYLYLANRLIHSIRPDAFTIAEDVSGMPGLAAPAHQGGADFNYRLAMGSPDFWFGLLKKVPDPQWNMGSIWHELTNRRADEQTIAYVESHDQAIVGDKTSIFWMLDAEMYTSMRSSDTSPVLDRGIALHKMMRLITASLAGNGYLNFMGNEFGHPEWIDFPREGNNWSYHHARRQWSLRDNPDLKYHFLADFDQAMVRIIRDNAIIESGEPRLMKSDQANQVIIFERSNFFFAFNFNPEKSFTDYPFEVPAGDYRLLLDTDSASFGGHQRVEPDQIYIPQPKVEKSTLKQMISLYLPCRTALVLARIK